jgi:integrase
VAEAAALWLKSREGKIERASLKSYSEHVALHIIPLIGAVKLSALNVPTVRALEDRLSEEGRSPAMVRKVLATLSGVLSDAQDRGLVVQNVVRNRRSNNGRGEARAKRRLEAGRDIPTPAEIRSIIAHLNGPGRARPLLLTAIFTGLRASELRGLRWSDVDLVKGELHVRQRADRFSAIGHPKSGAGRRNVPLLPMVVNALKEWKLACPPNAADLVFPGTRGVLALMTIIKFDWQPVQITAGVVDRDGSAKYPGLHSLRHFYASWCINRRVDGGLELPIKVVQSRLGHATAAMTTDTYGHLFPRGDAAAEMVAAERAFMAVPT